MRKKKILAGLVTAAMLLGVTGCSMPFGSKEPTAQELISGIENMDREKYNNMEIVLDASVSDGEQSMTMGLLSTVEMKDQLVHMYDTSISVGMSGFNMDISMEGWVDYAENVSYVNMTAFGQESGWTKSPVDETSSVADITEMASLFSNVSADNAVMSHEKGQDYVVGWTMDAAELSDLMSDMLSGYGADGLELTTLQVTANFDETSKQIKVISMGADVSQDGAMSNMTMEIRFKTINGEGSLSIPEDVLSSAVEESYDYGYEDTPDDSYGGFGGDDGFTYGDSTSHVIDDGEGTDAVIDPLAQYLVIADGGAGTVYVYHQDGESALQYHVSYEDWYGMMVVKHITDTDFVFITDQYQAQFDWLSTGWYDSSDLLTGSRDDDAAIFGKVDDDGCAEVDFVGYTNDLYVEATLYDYTGDMDNLLAQLNELLGYLPY